MSYPSKVETMSRKKQPDSRAQRDADMNSSAAPCNTTAPRKAPDMPEDERYKERDPERDYAGPARKGH